MNAPNIGDRLARIRRRRGLTQEQLAERAAVSISVIRKLERADRDSASLPTLRKLAAALDVTTVELFEPVPRFDAPPDPDDRDDLYAIRRVLQPARAARNGGGIVTLADDEETPTLDSVRQTAREVGGMFRDSAYAEAVIALPTAIAHGRRATAALDGTARDTAWEQLGQAYLTAGMVLTQLRRDDLAYQALGLAIDAGQQAGDEVFLAAVVCAENWLFTCQGRFDDAERAALTSAEAVEPSLTKSPLAHIGTWAWLNMGAAAAAARNNRPDVAADALRRAHAAAIVAAPYRSPDAAHWTSVSPTTVAMRQAELAMVAGQPDVTLRVAQTIPDDARPRVTHQRFQLDVAAAHLEQRQADEALQILLRLRADVPSWLKYQRYARTLTKQLLATRARTVPQELRELADFLDVRD